MSGPQIKAAIFDAYGTLLDVHGAMARHATRLGPDWPQISAEWRAKQLEYSWIRSLAGPTQHRNFWDLTREALHYVAARHGIEDATLLDDVLGAYRVLTAYQEVPAVLAQLRSQGIGRAILSNGEPDMLASAARAAGIDMLLDEVLSVEAVGVFKPDPRVYQLPVQRFRLEPGQMAFLSSNPWDAFGALANGYPVFWINRTRQPDEYGLRGQVAELPDLASLPAALA